MNFEESVAVVEFVFCLGIFLLIETKIEKNGEGNSGGLKPEDLNFAEFFKVHVLDHL